MNNNNEGKATKVKQLHMWNIATYINAYGKAYACYPPGTVVDVNHWEKLFNTKREAEMYVRRQHRKGRKLLDKLFPKIL